MRVVVLGIDGLDRLAVDRFESALSTVAELSERGVCTPLESTHPAATASTWPSLYTGTGPSHHGVFGATAADAYPDEARPVSRVDVRRPALWDYLSSEGSSSIALNVPLTHPADPINGIVVPGALAPEDEPGYPDGIRDDLSDAVGEPYRLSRRSVAARATGGLDLEDGRPGPVSGPNPGVDSDSVRRDPLERTLAVVDQRRTALGTLLEREEWELAICRVVGIDAFVDDEREHARVGTRTNATANGNAGPPLPADGVGSDEDDRRAIYAAVDRVVESVLETVDDETNVVVCSTRGVAPVVGYRLNLNEFLRECGYVETVDAARAVVSADRSGGAARSDGEAQLEMERAPGTDPDAESGSESASEPGRTVGQTGETRDEPAAERESAPALPVSLERTRLAVSGVARRLGLESLLERVGRAARPVRSSAEAIDWRESLAFCVAGERMGVRINLAGREPNGQVPPSKYELVRDDLVELLSRLETPAGEPAFEFVCRCEHLHDGPFLEGAPDVLFRPKRSNHTVSAGLPGRTFESVATVGSTPEGLFVGAGPAFDDRSPDPHRLSVPDVAPIVLGALGRPVPSLMTGRVPENVLCEHPERGKYLNVAMGATTTDPTFDDGDIPARVDGVNSRSWEW